MSTMTLAQTNGSAKGMQPLLQLTVQEFFQAVNWENKPPEPEPILQDFDDANLGDSPITGASTELSMAMSVHAFFDAVPWDGVPIVAAPVPVEEPVAEAPPTEKDMTLEDFFGGF